MPQPQFNYTAIRADPVTIRTPLDVIGLVNKQFARVASVLGGPQRLDRGQVPTAITINPATVDLTTLELTGNATLTLEMVRTRVGSEGKIELTQDATGGRTPTWVNALTTPTISATANKRTLLLAVRSTDGWILTTLASGY
jgi:hypothetical protein